MTVDVTPPLPPDPLAESPSLDNVLEALDRLSAMLFTDAATQDRGQQARQNWVSGVSHDLKSPLTAIRGYAEVLGAGAASEVELQRIARAIVRCSQTMEALIGDLDMSMRIRSGGDLVIARELVDLTAVVRHVLAVQALDPLYPDRILRQTGETAGVFVKGDEHLLRRAVTNMVVNAMAHNPAGTTVTVSAVADGAMARVVVDDDGVGLDPAVLDAYSESEVSGPRGSVTGPVIGMGMDIARQFVVAHEGHISLESSSKSGTRIELVMPLASGVAPDHVSP